MPTLIKGGRVIDPGRLDGIADILVDEGKIVRIGDHASENIGVSGSLGTPTILNASGMLVLPGLIDMHVHLREPGHEYKETIATGCRAAAAGGITAVCAMPDTRPVNDTRQVTDFILQKAKAADSVRVYPVAAISQGLGGTCLCEYAELKEAGAVAFSNDALPVTNSQLMRRALEYAKSFGMLIISHCEDPGLSRENGMNEGAVATRMGLAGIPGAAESIMVMRDIALCELTGARLHIAHVSTKDAVRALREAKKRGVPVTAETAPHYFTLTENAMTTYNTNLKTNPPLRSEADVEAILEGLADGTIDVIATDHAPQTCLEKDVEFDRAQDGIVGLETSVALSLTLVDKGVLSYAGLAEKMSVNPARILGLKNGLRAGADADITIIDPAMSFTVDAGQFFSLSRNTPFDGWQLKGKAVLTMVGGVIKYHAPKSLA
ncbi:MAG: dihydroorotase [Desulfobacterales bacterium]|nr:dihydroorotase [Desulfobacterales bacterium]